MENFSQETYSIWQKTDPPFLPSLSTHEAVDVCIIGGGIAGLSTAYSLLESGKSVAVIDRNSLSTGQSWLTSAHLSPVLGTRYFDLKRMHGAEGIRVIAESHTRAIDEIERIITNESIACDFVRVPGYLFLGPEDKEETLHKELEACQEAGLRSVELLPAGQSPLFPSGPCLRFGAQGRFHPGKYLRGLARAAQKKGGKIFSHTEALEIQGGRTARVATNRGFQVIAQAVVVATNVPVNDRVTMYTKMAPYRTYVIGLQVPADRLDLSLFWDTSDPYHYVRTCRDDNGEEILLVGGEDHRTGQDYEGGEQFLRLREWARDRLGIEGSVRYYWSGQVIEAHDGIAYIGRNPGDDENVFIVTGDSGNGLTHGSLAALLLRDLVLGQENAWAEVYSPSRVNLRSLGTFVSENTKSTAPYADWVSGGDVASMDEIPAGEGAVLRDGAQKIAVYRDHQSRVHCFSAVCPHLSGIVRWNGVEKTWDCPCHGSRFDRMGHVINGPATVGLRAIADNTVREADAASA